jgi:glycogen debranching enzyme
LNSSLECVRSIWRLLVFLLLFFTSVAGAQTSLPSKFTLKSSGLELERHTQPGSFFDVVGRKSAVFGYENRALEVWVYPLKILDDFALSFRLRGYPLEIHGPDIVTSITVRPEATIFTYSHSAFTVRQIIFAPIEEPGIVMLLDVQSVLPMTVTCSFRPKLKLMWPAGLMTANLEWDQQAHTYWITEESRRYVGVIGSPIAEDISLMPYQEEPRDVPVRFQLEIPREAMRDSFVPVVIVGSIEGREKARAAYNRLLGSAQSLYEENVAYYERLQNETVSLVTPDERINTAFEWAKIGIDKGIATNPLLGTGLVAGFRTSGESERPGFAWFFGRDAMWTALAITSYGDFASTRIVLNFLKKFQRADGKIPHEVSQSAPFIAWFTDYPYPWASADATPLYIIAHADYWRASGDIDFIKRNWDSIIRAYRFTAATDADGNGLIENTNVGHGWVEGGALYPPHEEIYLQGVWIEALRGLAELADAMNDAKLAADARAAAQATSEAVEQTYWLPEKGFYAFATTLSGVRGTSSKGEARQLSKARLIAEDTVLPAVPLWWRELDERRAQSEIDHLGSGQIATDWGARILSNRSGLYDPLSYHHGSVWPLFTGWMAMGAYRYGRPHVGYQAIAANVLLTYEGALGYVTELLSGDFNAPFGRSSHHQVWSEAMVVTPILRGLLGIEVSAGGRYLTFAPQLPADWDRVAVRNVRAGADRYDLLLKRAAGRETVKVTRRFGQGQASHSNRQITVAPAFPLNAKIRSVTVNGRASQFNLEYTGDVQRPKVNVDDEAEIVFTYDEGTDVYVEREPLKPGQTNQGLRILRVRADESALSLVVEGLGGREYSLLVRTPRRLGKTSAVRIVQEGSSTRLLVRFDGPSDAYIRRELAIPLLAR